MPLYDLQKERLKRRTLKKLSKSALIGLRGRKPKNISALIIICVFLLLAYLVPSPQGEAFAGNALVIDGDTLQINRQRFRLYGIDAPESDQTCKRGNEIYLCGKEATGALTRFVAGQAIVCEKKDIDKYNRIVAICRIGEKELNKWMVTNGYAVSYQQYSSRYLFDEMKARLSGNGVWAGSFQMPWDYRHGRK